MPGKVARVKLERHLLPTDKHVENMKCRSAYKTNFGAEKFCNFGFGLAASPKTEWLTRGHLVAEQSHDFDLLVVSIFVKVFHN